MKYLMRQIKVKVTDDQSVDFNKYIAKKLNVDETQIKNIIISKKSIDARNKDDIYYVYELVFEYDCILKENQNIIKYEESNYSINIPKIKKNIIIVGSGPAGLMSAYILSKTGNNVTVLERGDCLEKRKAVVEKFWQTGILDINSNVQFGEGGAGTFSDGKLNTQIKDKEHIGKLLLEIFCECGADKKIMYENNPHIGTDKLFDIIKTLRKKIIGYGGKFLYNTMLTNIIHENGRLQKIEINNEQQISCDKLILAIGHSARDTFQILNDIGITLESKPFAVGVRIQHSQKLINRQQYGKYFEILPPAAYKLTYKANNGRGVYSFCMCPGGYVVNASSDLKKLAINGMSYSKRDSENANSAIIVTVSENDYGAGPLAGIRFQETLEKKAYELCNGKIPCMSYGDFKNCQVVSEENTVKPVMKGSYDFANIKKVFPDYINVSLIEAIEHFGKLIPGFNNDDVILSAVESRTSSPVRILRDSNYECNIKNIYPCGEGSGYAGGIISSAIDGIRIANAINDDK